MSKFRFAPSPNGLLHAGHAASALFTNNAARRHGGEFLLRIEDIDHTRCREEFITAIYQDLSWLGLTWPQPVRRQSEHLPSYHNAIAELNAMGLLYPCFCTRRQMLETTDQSECDPDGRPLYQGHCRSLPANDITRRIAQNEPHALRLNMRRAVSMLNAPLHYQELGIGPQGETGTITANPKIWGDVILARKDIHTSYHIAVVADDAAQEITHVTRGLDLFYATALHRLLQHLLQLPVPIYHHHPLIDDDTGRKLSKTSNDLSLRAIREAGTSPQDLCQQLGITL